MTSFNYYQQPKLFTFEMVIKPRLIPFFLLSNVIHVEKIFWKNIIQTQHTPTITKGYKLVVPTEDADNYIRFLPVRTLGHLVKRLLQFALSLEMFSIENQNHYKQFVT
uniref:Uncharacterized protein n=1 Tax=Glossina austeni TaxID=7395 RepID=A0A1A9VNR5_GLOAU